LWYISELGKFFTPNFKAQMKSVKDFLQYILPVPIFLFLLIFFGIKVFNLDIPTFMKSDSSSYFNFYSGLASIFSGLFYFLGLFWVVVYIQIPSIIRIYTPLKLFTFFCKESELSFFTSSQSQLFAFELHKQFIKFEIVNTGFNTILTSKQFEIDGEFTKTKIVLALKEAINSVYSDFHERDIITNTVVVFLKLFPEVVNSEQIGLIQLAILYKTGYKSSLDDFEKFHLNLLLRFAKYETTHNSQMPFLKMMKIIEIWTLILPSESKKTFQEIYQNNGDFEDMVQYLINKGVR
jgi:hypothetical protein